MYGVSKMTLGNMCGREFVRDSSKLVQCFDLNEYHWGN